MKTTFTFPFSFFFLLFFSIFISTSIQSTFYIGRESKYWTITNEKSFLSEKPVTFHEMTKLFCESWSISPLLFCHYYCGCKAIQKYCFWWKTFAENWKLVMIGALLSLPQLKLLLLLILLTLLLLPTWNVLIAFSRLNSSAALTLQPNSDLFFPLVDTILLKKLKVFVFYNVLLGKLSISKLIISFKSFNWSVSILYVFTI